MRMPPHRMGSHPKVRTSSFRAWYFDETSGEDSPCVWSSPGISQAYSSNAILHAGGPSAPPFIIDAPIGMARRFISSDSMALMAAETTLTPDTESQTAFLATDASFACWIKVNSAAPSDNETIASLVGLSDSGTAANNYLFSLRIMSDFTLKVEHEHGAGTAETYVTNYTIPLDRWVYICIVKEAVTTTVKYKLYANGRFIEESGALTNCSDGGNAYWQFGGAEDSFSNLVLLLTDSSIAGIYTWDTSLSAAEVLQDYRRGLLKDFHTGDDLKIYIDNGNTETSGGQTESVFVDATDIDGVDFVDSVSISTSPDDAVVQGTAKLTREQSNLSIAYLKNDTKINFPDPTVGTSGPRFIDVNRGIKIYYSRVPLGTTATGRQFWPIMNGSIDIFNWGSEEVSVSFRDLGGVLVDTFIETERDYGSSAGILVYTEMQQILDDNSDDIGGINGSYNSPTLYFDPSINWAIKGFTQRREPVMVALRTLAGQFGHDLKYRWNNAFNDFRLTLYQPETDDVTPGLYFDQNEIISVSQAEIAVQRIRNAVRVSYDSSESSTTQDATVAAFNLTLPPNLQVVSNGAGGTDSNGEFIPAFVMIEDSDSIAKYGRRFMEVQDATTSRIDTASESLEMAYRMINDLSEPEFTHSVTCQLTPEIDIHDVIGFSENNILYTDDQFLAVSSVSHTIGSDAKTTIEVRGRPNLGARRWLSIESRMAPVPTNTPYQASTGITKTHRMQSLQSILSRSQVNMGGRFMQTRNSAFTTFSNGRENPPTSWSVSAGAYNATDMGTSTTSRTGPLSVFISSLSNTLESELMPFDGGSFVPYGLECNWLIDSVNPTSTDTVEVHIDFYDEDRVFVPGSRQSFVPGSGFPSVSQDTQEWYVSRSIGIQPPGADAAKFYKLTIEKKGGLGDSIVVDNVSFYPSAVGARIFESNPGLWTNFPDNGGDYTVLAYTSNIQFGDVLTSGSYDYGGNVNVDAAAAPPGSYDGYYYQIPYSGYYGISARCFMVGVNSSIVGAAVGTLTSAMTIRKGVVYNENGNVTTLGTTLASSPFVSTSYNIPVSSSEIFYEPMVVPETTLYLDAGDKISCVYLPGGDSAKSANFQSGPSIVGPFSDFSFFQIRALD